MVFFFGNIKYVLSVGSIVAAFSFLQAQTDFAKIDKNRNVQAKDLYHDLNASKDTLILRSKKKINYLYSINKDYSRELDFYIDTTAYKLPLNKLSLGKHVFVAVQSPLRIVFVIHVLKEIPIHAPKPKKKPVKKPVAIRVTETTFGENKK